jgi:hypothetical protein
MACASFIYEKKGLLYMGKPETAQQKKELEKEIEV